MSTPVLGNSISSIVNEEAGQIPFPVISSSMSQIYPFSIYVFHLFSRSGASLEAGFYRFFDVERSFFSCSSWG